MAVTQYVSDHPTINPNEVSKDNFFQRFFFDKDFLNSLNGEGLKLASKVTVRDILDELKPYADKFPEVLWVYNIIKRHYAWCEKNLVAMKRKYLVVA